MPTKFNIGAMSQFVIRNPFTTAAAVFAPIFAQNEDRGYYRTALITTPIIFATGQAVPKLFAGVRDLGKATLQARNVLQKAEKWTRFEQPNFHDLSTLFKNPASNSNTIEQALSAYLVTEKKSRDFMKEQKSLTKYFNRRFVKTADLIGKANMGDLEALSRIAEIDNLHATKGRLISNAMHVARRSSLTPSEWITEESGALPDLNNEQLISTFEQYKDRPQFVRTLKNRLRETGKLNYSGMSRAASGEPLPKITSTIPLDFTFDDAAQVAFKNQASGAFKALEEAKKRGFIKDASVEAEMVTSGEIGRILNVKVTRRGNIKPLQIPIVDPVTGQVRLNANAIGVGNYVIGPDKNAYRIDEWVSKMLAEQPHLSNEQLEEEIAAHAYWFAGDPLDPRRMSELESFGKEGASTLNAQAIKLRSFGAGITKLPLFENEKGDFLSYAQFQSPEKVNFIRGLMNTNKYINMGSEAGIYEGRWQLREAANLSPFGAPSAEKQDSIWRSVTKEFHLKGNKGTIPEEARLGWRSTSWEALTGSADLPAAKFTVAGLNPQDRTLFSELPSTLDELHFRRSDITQKFIDRGMSPKDASSMYEDVYQMYKSGNKEALSYLGSMGETGFVMAPDFAENFYVEGVSKYDMDELAKESGYVHPDEVLGFNNGERVLPKFAGEIESIATGRNGFVMNIKHRLGLQGAKLDIAGVKGMTRVTSTNEHFDQLKTLMNDFYRRTGSGDVISDNVNVLAPAEYFTNKVEPSHAYLGIGSDLVNRLDKAGASSISEEYLSKMSKEGAEFQGGQFVIDSSKNPTRDAEVAERLMNLSAINEEFFAKAGEAIRSAGGYQDPVLTAYVNSGKKLGDFMLKNQLPAMGFTWDHSLANAPRFSSISFDVETYMALGGNFAGLKAMRNRLQTVSGGDQRQALEFTKHMIAGDFKKPLGSTVTLADAFTTKGSLTSASGRAGTIFDPSIESYKKNFSIDLGNGRFLPVPGTEAYGAEASQFEPGKYQTRPWQHTLQEMAFEKDPAELGGLEKKLLSEYKQQFAVGKGSALRPYQYDPLGVPGFLSTTAEQGDPFVAKVSREWAERVHSKRLRKALLEGEDVVGMLHRQPTNELLYLKYRVDPTLNGTFDVAVPESVSRTLMGDQDKDLVNSILFDANIRTEGGKMIVSSAASQSERDAAEEALEAMSGKQQKQLAIWQSIKGSDEVAKMNTTFELASLAAKNEKFATAISRRTGVAVNRTAGAAIGAYSNVLTEMVEHMARNPVMMRDPDLVQRLKTGLFDIRQAPISARKAHTSFSLETAMTKVDQLRKAVAMSNPDASAEKVNQVLLGMSKTLTSGGEDGPEYKYWAAQGAEDLKAWAYGRSEKARMMKEVFTTAIQDGRPFEEQRIAKELPHIFSDIEGVMGSIHGGRVATETSSELGRTAAYLSSVGRDLGATATGKISKIFETHGKALALGLGTLAALGVAMTPRTAPVATFSRASGNKYRPEERMGVADSVPGEPVPGQMAPSSPPRRMGIARGGVRTSVVAPMNATSDLTVRMKAVDQSRAAETARLLSQIPGSGDSNVTVNYRDRTKLRSLRTREKIREIR